MRDSSLASSERLAGPLRIAAVSSPSTTPGPIEVAKVRRRVVISVTIDVIHGLAALDKTTNWAMVVISVVEAVRDITVIGRKKAAVIVSIEVNSALCISVGGVSFLVEVSDDAITRVADCAEARPTSTVVVFIVILSLGSAITIYSGAVLEAVTINISVTINDSILDFLRTTAIIIAIVANGAVAVVTLNNYIYGPTIVFIVVNLFAVIITIFNAVETVVIATITLCTAITVHLAAVVIAIMVFLSNAVVSADAAMAFFIVVILSRNSKEIVYTGAAII